MTEIAFTLGWINVFVSALNAVAWRRTGDAMCAFWCGCSGIYAVLIIPEYWP